MRKISPLESIFTLYVKGIQCHEDEYEMMKKKIGPDVRGVKSNIKKDRARENYCECAVNPSRYDVEIPVASAKTPSRPERYLFTHQVLPFPHATVVVLDANLRSFPRTMPSSPANNFTAILAWTKTRPFSHVERAGA